MSLKSILNQTISKVRNEDEYKEVEKECNTIIEEIKSFLPDEKKVLVSCLVKAMVTQDNIYDEKIFIEGILIGSKIPKAI